MRFPVINNVKTFKLEKMKLQSWDGFLGWVIGFADAGSGLGTGLGAEGFALKEAKNFLALAGSSARLF